MPVQLRCSCGKLLRVRDDLVGKRVRCPGCAAAVLVKAPPPPEDEALQEAPPPRQPARAAVAPPPPRRREFEDEPERAPEAQGRPRPRPAVKQDQGYLVLWLALGGVGLVAVVAVVLVIALSGRDGAPKGPGGPEGGGPRVQGPPGPQPEFGEGFITSWLLLAPIPLEENQSGADALNKEQIKDEANLRPRIGDVVKVGDRELVWKEYHARAHYFDFNDFLGGQTEESVGYAVCYVHAPAEMQGVQLRLGSDDQAKVYLNGQEVFKQDQARALMKDQDTTEVTLRAGVNVLVFKVINEKLDWSGCARFTDLDGHVIKGLKFTTTPE
jgi:DNA-directed RNA polymerase subunit RPC12/RpoP